MSDEQSGRWVGYTPNFEMSVIGYVIAVVMVVLLIPLLPVMVVGWIALRLWQLLRGPPEEPRRLSWPARTQQRA